ncbi:hypothetical protein V8G54_028867 [Vigna mungo]|uniref:Uncharacterized protein n=1 Tax=Vigna mungo TaxID=3915 RepID=A0AAQ3RJT3_VIGMU
MATPTEDDIPSPNEAKRKKGIVRMKKIVRARSEGKKLEVSWNAKGEPIEPGGAKFISYLGSIVRANVPITYDDWKDSSLDAYKEIIWNDIQEKSIQNKERALSSKYPYRGSRKGYARIEQDMVS